MSWQTKTETTLGKRRMHHIINLLYKFTFVEKCKTFVIDRSYQNYNWGKKTENAPYTILSFKKNLVEKTQN